ncbi:MAG: RecX family transcriptional regulator [Bacteroidetes bacterium]|nr:MAG: RecX family transcriptional regulator [Bacteroidota bacterium]
MIGLTYEQALHRLQKWCALQDRCEQEVLQKLRSFQLKEEEIARVMEQLRKERFLDEERFARSYVQGKFNQKRWGRIKIRAYLKQKSVPESIIREAFSELSEDDYEETIAYLIARKEKELGGRKEDFETKVKIQRYLMGKGFESELIIRKLGE